MPPITRRARREWAISHVFALPEMWAIVAEHSGVVGAFRLKRVCKAARVGSKEWLRTLSGLVVCGGRAGVVEIRSEVIGGWIWRSFDGDACLASRAEAPATRAAR